MEKYPHEMRFSLPTRLGLELLAMLAMRGCTFREWVQSTIDEALKAPPVFAYSEVIDETIEFSTDVIDRAVYALGDLAREWQLVSGKPCFPRDVLVHILTSKAMREIAVVRATNGQDLRLIAVQFQHLGTDNCHEKILAIGRRVLAGGCAPLLTRATTAELRVKAKHAQAEINEREAKKARDQLAAEIARATRAADEAAQVEARLNNALRNFDQAVAS